MLPEHYLSVLAKYDRLLERSHFDAVQCPSEVSAPAAPDVLGHVRWMCSEVRRLVQEGSLDKAGRWLGFIQGCLWSFGFYTIDQMRDDNRSTTSCKHP